uniref:RNase H domain-containing protein n=1 Tax=Rhabditophanes sp. KR3021 TaxID=114890 RepID=A0AC35TR57_9BILA
MFLRNIQRSSTFSSSTRPVADYLDKAFSGSDKWLAKDTSEISEREEVQIGVAYHFENDDWKKNRYGLLWRKNEDKDKIMSFPTKGAGDISKGSLMAIRDAITIAKDELKLSKLDIKTYDSFTSLMFNKFLPSWEQNGYKKKDNNDVKNIDLLKEISYLKKDFPVRLSDDKLGPDEIYENKVMKWILERGKFTCDDELTVMERKALVDPAYFGSYLAYSNGYWQVKKHKPIYYTSCTPKSSNFLNTKNKDIVIGISNPEIDYEFASYISMNPPTMLRGHMIAINKAVRDAVERGYKDICVYTDSEYFIRFYNRKWLKNDGNLVANQALYHELQELAKNVDITFRRFRDDEDPKKIMVAKNLAVNYDGKERISITEKTTKSSDKKNELTKK